MDQATQDATLITELSRLSGKDVLWRLAALEALDKATSGERALILCASAEEQLQIVDALISKGKARSSDEEHVLKKARMSKDSASELANGTKWQRHAWKPTSSYVADHLGEAGFFGFRPEASPPANIPAELVAPEFGYILQAAEQAALPPDLTKADGRKLYDAIPKLLEHASDLHAKELELQDGFLRWHNTQLGVGNMSRYGTSASASQHGDTHHDGKLTSADGKYIVALMECKRDDGSGVALIQALRYYQQHYQDGSIWEKSTQAQADPLPALVLLLEGPYLSIYAVWTIYQNRVGYAPLTPGYVLANDPSYRANVWRLMAVLDAYRKAAKGLRKHYEDLADLAKSGDIGRRARLRRAACITEKNGAQQELPCTLPDCLLEEKLGLDNIRYMGPHLLYRATMGQEGSGGRLWVVVKFVHGEYGQQVHEAWHGAGLAPKLWLVQEVGAFKMVVMDDLRKEDGWQALSAVQQEAEKQDALRAAVIGALDRAHQVDLPCGGRAAHGDARGPNVFVRNIYDKEEAEVRFIDFDWAGVDGMATYPPVSLNENNPWHPDVRPGATIWQAHDKHLLERYLSSP